jgi:STAS domain
MFRMTRLTSRDGGPALRLEGELRPPWLPVLESEVDRLLRSGHRVVLDFEGVTFVSPGTVDTLHRLVARGVAIENATEWVWFLLQRGNAP